MHFEDPESTVAGRQIDGDVAIEASGAKQGRVKDIAAVCCRENNDGFSLLEPVHFAEDLVECLFAFIMTATDASTAHASDRVDFVDEHNAGRRFACGFEKVTDPCCTDADEHLNEFGTVDGEKRNTGLTCGSASEQGFSGSRRPNKEYSLGDFGTESCEATRIFEELDDFLQVLFGGFQTSHIIELC